MEEWLPATGPLSRMSLVYPDDVKVLGGIQNLIEIICKKNVSFSVLYREHKALTMLGENISVSCLIS